MSEEYTHEDIARGLFGDRSIQEILQTLLVSVAKLNLRVESIDNAIDAIVERIEEESE